VVGLDVSVTPSSSSLWAIIEPETSTELRENVRSRSVRRPYANLCAWTLSPCSNEYVWTASVSRALSFHFHSSAAPSACGCEATPELSPRTPASRYCISV